MKISTIIENMKKYHKGYGTIDEEKTRDKVLYGNVDQECTGIVTSCWASVDVIKYVIEKGANLIISHEALFWNHGDHQEWLEESKNSVYLEKRKLPGNNKNIHLYLTDIGNKLAEEHKKFDFEGHSKMLSALLKEHTEEELNSFFGVLDSVTKYLSK